MIRQMTLGQYYPANSIIHRLDPRVKLFETMIFIIALFLVHNPLGYAIVTAWIVLIIYLSKVPVNFMLRGLRGIVTLLVIAGLFNLFLTPGSVLLALGPLQITDMGLANAILMTVRMIYLIVGSSVMTLTTTPSQLTDGLEAALRPLSYLKVPIHEIAMMMSIALRFIPILIEETDKIMKAQMARGADFEEGNIIQRAKNMIPLLVPLFISAFRRAYDLALAMEARCYNGGEGRTKMKPLIYQRRDRIAYGLILAFLGILILLHFVMP